MVGFACRTPEVALDKDFELTAAIALLWQAIEATPVFSAADAVRAPVVPC
jgi:hypothetical protein